MFSSKCLARGQLVASSRGVLPVEQIVVGDCVFDEDSVPRAVVKIHNGYGPAFHVQAGAYEYVVNDEHLITLCDEYGALLDVPAKHCADYLDSYPAHWSVSLTGRQPAPVVTQIAPHEFVGLEVAGGGRFVLANGVVTHNTTSMAAIIERYNIAKKRCLIVKHSSDCRYKCEHGGIMFHNGTEYSRVEVVSCAELSALDVTPYDVIGVDEAQFFSDIVEVANEWAKTKVVVCAALDADYLRRPFGPIPGLIASAEEVHKLKAVCCRCQQDASFTARITDEVGVNVVGGSDKYSALCRAC
jgi:thymidine kinase